MLEHKNTNPSSYFCDEFSKKEDGSFYEPHKQNNKKKNISNYGIHKTSIKPYKKCGNEVISYIINTPKRLFILASCFVFKDVV
ncbi:hypothetical protein [Spiroplasma kunkelii]|nr:hypothetical protein [Spiroplasma kunkelii]